MNSLTWIVVLAASWTLAANACGEEQDAAAKKTYAAHGKIVRLDAALDAIIPKEAKMERLADGFEWSEGPVWSKKGGYLLFSDIPRNQIVKWQPTSGISVFREKAGYTGEAEFTGGEPGTNGLTFDSEGNLVTCAHGDRVIQRFAGGKADGKRTILAAKYEGKRLNSPNDLVYKSNGDLYFTDPPYGLPKQYDDPGRELDWCGVYRVAKSDGKLTLLTKEMTRPNGIAFSPDEKTLYVANSDPKLAIWKAFPVKDDGTLGKGKVIHDVTELVGEKNPGLPDGMKVDAKGNLFATGPGGVWILTAEGKPLGRLDTGEATANCGFGDDGSTLYITADMYLLRIKLATKGLGF
ncbi:MAG: SMP-30/gluconolactonase/LRE family protein [Pirellulales bacterium]